MPSMPSMPQRIERPRRGATTEADAWAAAWCSPAAIEALASLNGPLEHSSAKLSQAENIPGQEVRELPCVAWPDQHNGLGWKDFSWFLMHFGPA